jgi:NADH dehydrogenase
VEIRTGVTVDRVDATGVWVAGQRIESETVLWTAGVQASPLIEKLGVQTDRVGRAIVGNLFDVPSHPNVFVIGDAASVVRDEHPLPGVAQVAIQSGGFVGRVLVARLAGQRFTKAFRYQDRGNMAVVGKNFAILERGKLQMSGTLTWVLWA